MATTIIISRRVNPEFLFFRENLYIISSFRKEKVYFSFYSREGKKRKLYLGRGALSLLEKFGDEIFFLCKEQRGR